MLTVKIKDLFVFVFVHLENPEKKEVGTNRGKEKNSTGKTKTTSLRT